MIYRKLDENGDMIFGQGRNEFLRNTPETVAQAIKTRLNLSEGEWFLDVTEGTPWHSRILGRNNKSIADFFVRERILNTQGVTEITKYESLLDPDTRGFSVSVEVNTLYGIATVTI